MKETLRTIFWPILKPFEGGEPGPQYRASHRTILKTVGVLFTLLACVSGAAVAYTANWAALFPVVVFFAIGMVCLIVGALGSDGAVSRIWRNH